MLNSEGQDPQLPPRLWISTCRDASSGHLTVARENSSTPHQTRPRPLSLTGLEAKCYATPDASGKPASRPAGLISTLLRIQGGILRAHSAPA